MTAKRIPQLDAITGAGTANDDNLVIFDTSANTTKRILRSQLADGLVNDLPYAASSGSSLVGHIQSGTGAVATTVQAKLRESVSVKDFGAVGDGVTDDTAAIQAALDSGTKRIEFPDGHYITSSLIKIPNNICLIGMSGSPYSTTYTGFVIIESSASSVAFALKEGYDDTDNSQGVVIENLMFLTASGATGQTLMQWESAKNCTMRDVTLKIRGNNSVCFHLLGETLTDTYSGCFYNSFINVRFGGSTSFDGAQNGQIGLKISGNYNAGQCNANTFVECNIREVDTAAEIDGADATTLVGVSVEDCASNGVLVGLNPPTVSLEKVNNLTWVGGYTEKIGTTASPQPFAKFADLTLVARNTILNVLDGANAEPPELYRDNIYQYGNIYYVGAAGNSGFKCAIVGASSTTEITGAGIRSDQIEAKITALTQSQQTISSGAITASSSYIKVDTEGSAATDDLDNINGAVLVGQIITLQAQNSARTVVVKDGTGNLRLAGDMSLDHTNDSITLIETSGVWNEVSRSDNAT